MAAGQEGMPGRRDVSLAAQSPGFLHVQHLHFCVALDGCCTASLAEPLVSTAGWVVSVVLLKQTKGQVSLGARAVGLAQGCSAGAAKAPSCASPSSAPLSQENLHCPKPTWL